MRTKNRVTHLWYLLWWIIILSFVIVIYHGIVGADILTLSPSQWTTVDNIYRTIVGLIITSFVASITNFIFHEIKYGIASEHLVVRKFLPTFRFLTILIIWVIGGFSILESLQINTSGLLAGAGIGGAIFAIASRDIIANLLGSLSIIMSKMFEIGDMIRIKGHEGVVEEISMSYTKITNQEGKVVYVPNKILASESLENLTRRRFFLYTYRIPFRKNMANPEKARDMLHFIEGKLAEYDPLKVEIKTEIPNASDFVYVFEVQMPEEDAVFDREIREYLTDYIFPVA